MKACRLDHDPRAAARRAANTRYRERIAADPVFREKKRLDDNTRRASSAYETDVLNRHWAAFARLPVPPKE
jgi:hypothetical protein